jgi:hypothetical protein
VVFILIPYAILRFSLLITISDWRVDFLIITLSLILVIFLSIYFNRITNFFRRLTPFEKLILDLALYYFIFIVGPFVVLKFTLIKDLGWYIIYFIFIFPLTFFLFLLFYKVRFKNTIKYYKKVLSLLWLIFSLTYISLIVFVGYLIIKALENFRLSL